MADNDEKVSILFDVTIKDQGVKQLWDDMRNGQGTAKAGFDDFVKGVEQGGSKVKVSFKEMGKGKDAFKGNLVNLGNVAKFVFNSILGLGALQVMYKMVRGFTDLVKGGMDFAKELFKLGASVRSLQKAGLDITMKGTLEQIKLLREEFGVFSTRELIAGVGQMQLLTRQFGFTNDETINLTKSVAALAVVLGKDFANTAASVALFLSSGYGEALQRAGIAVNRLAVVEEAHRMGIKKSYTALTEVERAHAGYNLIIAQSKDVLEELVDYQKTYLGQIEKQKAQVEDLKNAMSLGLIPLNLAWAKIQVSAANIAIKAINLLLETWSRTFAAIIAGMGTVVMGFENLKSVISGKGWEFDTSDMLEMWKQTWEAMDEEAEKAKIKELDLESLFKFTGLDAANEAAAKKQNDAADQMLKIMDDLVSELLDIQNEYADASEKLWGDYVDDRNKIVADASQDLIDEYDDLLKDLADIEKDYARSVADAQEDAQKDIADLNKDTRNKIADANSKYREAEEKAERDHQERLKRLREEFLFDLEDALRERDALQVLRLIRRYNLDKAQENRNYENKLADLKDQNKKELEEIKKNEADKRKEIYASLQEQLADLRANYEEKRAEREAQYAEDVKAIKDNLEKDLQARKDQYDKELQDLKDSYWGSGGKLEEMLAEWAKTNEITEDQAKAITDVLGKYFGELGITDSIFNYYKASVAGIVADVLEQERVLEIVAAQALALQQQITDAANAAAASISALTGVPNIFGGLTAPPGTSSTANSSIFGGASGGSLIATKPQLIMVGEGGVPERIDIVPLSGSGKGGGNGKGTLEILLGSGLEANIIDNTLGQFDIILRKELGKK